MRPGGHIDLAPMLDLARVKLGNALKALKHGDLARDHTIDTLSAWRTSRSRVHSS